MHYTTRHRRHLAVIHGLQHGHHLGGGLRDNSDPVVGKNNDGRLEVFRTETVRDIIHGVMVDDTVRKPHQVRQYKNSISLPVRMLE